MTLPYSDNESVNSKLPSHLKGEVDLQPNQLHELLISREWKWVEEQLLLKCEEYLKLVTSNPVTPESLGHHNFHLGKRQGLLEFRQMLYDLLRTFHTKR
jgi:hypothetical protein